MGERFIQRMATFLDEHLAGWKGVVLNQIVTVSRRRDPLPGPNAMLIPLLLPLLKRYYPYSSADASGQPGRVRCKPHRRIS